MRKHTKDFLQSSSESLFFNEADSFVEPRLAIKGPCPVLACGTGPVIEKTSKQPKIVVAKSS